MTIAELTRFIQIESISPYYPFIYQVRPTYYQLASFWTDTFGVQNESSYIVSVIENVTFLFNQKLTKTISINDCIAGERSFYFDQSNQVLYIHVDHDYSNYLEDDVYKYGQILGFNDKKMIYVQDVEYLPYLKSVPSLAQQQDLADYDKLSLIVGSMVLDNTNQYFDIFINENIYGNDINIYFLDDDIEGPQRSDLQQLQSLFVENYSFSLTEFNVKIQDKRVSYNKKIPSTVFLESDYPYIDENLIGKPIPLIYGSPRYSTAYPVDGESVGNVTYRQAQVLTSLGTVQVKNGDSWLTVTPASVDISTGSFVLNYADCRDGGTTVGEVLECRVWLSEGITNTYASDVIKDLNDRELGLPYNNSNYNTEEWEIEEKFLSEIAVVFENQIELYEAIRQIQSGCNIGFRYEINSTGLITIRVNNLLRDPIGHIYNVDIQNRTSLDVESENDLLAAKINVDYNKDFNSGKSITYPYTDGSRAVLEAYNQEPTLSVFTFLTTQSGALSRAAWEYSRFSEIPRVVSLSLIGDQYLDLRIYDILSCEITPDFVDIDTLIYSGREYFGVWVVQVVAVDPQPGSKINNIKALLVKPYIVEILFKPDQSLDEMFFQPNQALDEVLFTNNK